MEFITFSLWIVTEFEINVNHIFDLCLGNLSVFISKWLPDSSYTNLVKLPSCIEPWMQAEVILAYYAISLSSADWTWSVIVYFDPHWDADIN